MGDTFESLSKYEIKIVKKYYRYTILAKPCLLLALLTFVEALFLTDYSYEIYYYEAFDALLAVMTLTALALVIAFFVLMLVPYFGMQRPAWQEIIHKANEQIVTNKPVTSLIELQQLQERDQIGDLKPKHLLIKGIIKRTRFGIQEIADYYHIELPKVHVVQTTFVIAPLVIFTLCASGIYFKSEQKEAYFAKVYALSNEKITESFTNLGFEHIELGYYSDYSDNHTVYCYKENDFGTDTLYVRVNEANEIIGAHFVHYLAKDLTAEDMLKDFYDFVDMCQSGFTDTGLKNLIPSPENAFRIPDEFVATFLEDNSSNIDLSTQRNVTSRSSVHVDFYYDSNLEYTTIGPSISLDVDFYGYN